MIRLIQSHSGDPRFLHLVSQLNEYLQKLDGEEHGYYSQFNKVENIPYVILALDHETPVGCGAIRPYSFEIMEIKRMFVINSERGRGIGGMILKSLEEWTLDLSYTECILETGLKQPDAIALYKKSGYQKIENYGPYIGMTNSICFRKILKNRG